MKQSFGCWLATLSIAFGSLVAAQPVAGQQAEKTYRVGILCGGCNDQEAPSRHAPIRQALRERGYVEGKNIAFEYRSAAGRYERFSDLAADLVRAKVDVIIAGGGLPGALAAKSATTTIPIVFVGLGEDPVQHGLVSSLSRPGGNVTGLVDRYADLIPKQLALLKEAVPSVSRVAVLWDAYLSLALEPSFQAMESALPSLGLQQYAIAVNGPDDLPDALRAARRARVEALILFPSPKFFVHLAEFARVTAEQKIPAISGFTDFARAGGLLSYGPDSKKTWRYAAVSVDKILKGTSPADIPVEQSDNIDLVVNLQTVEGAWTDRAASNFDVGERGHRLRAGTAFDEAVRLRFGQCVAQAGQMQRRDFITALGAAVTWPLAARVQQPAETKRIAIVFPSAKISELNLNRHTSQSGATARPQLAKATAHSRRIHWSTD